MLSNFFRRVQAERHPSLAMCSVFIAVGWCPNLAVPNTYRGSPAITMAATERVGLVLCALETSRYPHTVLLQGRAAHLYAPVRLRFGGGAATLSGGIERPISGVGASVQSTAEGSGIPGLHAPTRSTTQCQSLPEQHAQADPVKVQFGRRSKAVSRFNMSYTARASLWAKMVNAVPGPCFFSQRARYFCPAGLFRRKRTAASEKAHLR